MSKPRRRARLPFPYATLRLRHTVHEGLVLQAGPWLASLVLATALLLPLIFTGPGRLAAGPPADATPATAEAPAPSRKPSLLFRLGTPSSQRPAPNRGRLALLGLAFATAGVLAFLSHRLRRLPSSSDGLTTFGTAKWGSTDQLVHSGGLIIGADQEGQLLRWAEDAHLLTIAPTRSGKGVSLVIPNLLTYAGPVIVNDPKGELFAVTARHRARELHQRIVVFDPFGQLRNLGIDDLHAYILGSTPASVTRRERRGTPPPLVGSYNPLDALDPTSPTIIDDCTRLASLIVPSEGGASTVDNVFFREEAKNYIATMLLWTATVYERGHPERNLFTVRRQLSLDGLALEELLIEMSERYDYDGKLREAANRIRMQDHRTRANVVQETNRHVAYLDSLLMHRHLGVTSFDLARLAHQWATVYLILPATQIDTHGRFMALLMGAAIHGTMKAPAVRNQRLLVLLDEFPALGRMPIVEDCISLAAGFNMSLWLFVQDLNQLKAAYPQKWETLLGNTRILQAFGTNDEFTAEYLSKLLGTRTILSTSQGSNQGRSIGSGLLLGNERDSSNRSESTNVSHAQRRLLNPDEVRRIPKGEQILSVAGEFPLKTRRVVYFSDPIFAPLASPNPFHSGVHA